MTTLSIALSSAPADNSEALEYLRAYQVTERSQIPAVLLAMAMVEAGLYAQINDISKDVQSDYRDHALYLLAILSSGQSLDLDPNSAVGSANVSILQSMSTALGAKLSTLRDKITSYTVKTLTPFAKLTMHELLIARGTCPVKPVTHSNGFVVIQLLSDVEAHNPRLLADNLRTGERVRINNFRGVSSEGKYEAQVPREFIGADLYVDDAYGAL